MYICTELGANVSKARLKNWPLARFSATYCIYLNGDIHGQ
jgi:hypothetical protein